jgi:hypothetical protein
MSTTSVARRSAVAVPLIAGAAAAVALGVYGRLHDPTGVAIDIAGFSSFQAVKIAFTHWASSTANHAY